MMIRISGNIWLIRIQPIPIRVITPLRRASTYAAGRPMIVVSSAVTTATLRLLMRAADELMVLLGQRDPVVLEREVAPG